MQGTTRREVLDAAVHCFNNIANDIETAMEDAPKGLQMTVDGNASNRAEKPLRAELKKTLNMIQIPMLGCTLGPVECVVRRLASYVEELGVEDCLSTRDLLRRITKKADRAARAEDPRIVFTVLDDLETTVAKGVDTWARQIKARAMKTKQYGPAKRDRQGRTVLGEAAYYTGPREVRSGRDRPTGPPASEAVMAKAAQISRLLPSNEPVCFKYLTEKRACGPRCRRVPCNGRLVQEFEHALKAVGG